MPKEGHFIKRSNWLRAAVLGANDGIVSSASLLVGVSAAGMAQGNVLLTGLAGLTAGALSMAAGEYVSVSAQADVEKADLERERVALIEDPDYELSELAEGLENRGVESDLALEVAAQMTDHDALGAHAPKATWSVICAATSKARSLSTPRFSSPSASSLSS